MNTAKVVGFEAICANGLNKEDIFASVDFPASAIGAEGLASLSPFQWNQLVETTPSNFHDSRCTILGASALTRALRQAAWSASDLASAGFIFSSTTSQIDQWENDLPCFPKSGYDQNKIRAAVAQQSLGTPALRFMNHFKIYGPRALITSSCSASLQALALGLMWIRSGKVRRCIVGATEIHSELTRVGFGSLRLLSKDNCKPFDRNRAGINLGEGAAFMCLEASDVRTENPWGHLAGAGLSTDAYHPTSPHPEGAGSVVALGAALKSAGLQASDIDWIYAHGTGSPANDSAEAKAIEKVFPRRPWVTSTKSSHGHTLAASGVLESVLGLVALQKNKILPTFQFQDADPQIPLRVTSKSVDQVVGHFVKNSLGFGGINASVIFSREGGPR